MTRWFVPNPASVAPGVLAAQVTPPGVGTLLLPSTVAERLREFFYPGMEPPTFLGCSREGLLQMSLEWFSDRKILMLVNGPMSQEWCDIADDCGITVSIFDSAYGAVVDTETFRAAVQQEHSRPSFIRRATVSRTRSEPRRIPRPNSALSSKRELAHEGP